MAELWVLQRGFTALLYASQGGQLDVVKYLVEEYKADANVGDKVKQRTESNRLLGWFGG